MNFNASKIAADHNLSDTDTGDFAGVINGVTVSIADGSRGYFRFVGACGTILTAKTHGSSATPLVKAVKGHMHHDSIAHISRARSAKTLIARAVEMLAA
jgi:hypothetical protein